MKCMEVKNAWDITIFEVWYHSEAEIWIQTEIHPEHPVHDQAITGLDLDASLAPYANLRNQIREKFHERPP